MLKCFVGPMSSPEQAVVRVQQRCQLFLLPSCGIAAMPHFLFKQPAKISIEAGRYH
jgi:hypothetical protein